jgi:hypothetical protein
LLVAVLIATLLGYVLMQSNMQEAETQTQDAARQGTESPTYAAGSEEQAAPDRIIVKLEENASRAGLEEINEENNASTEKDLPRSQVNVVDLPRDLPVGEAIETYEANPNVEFAEPDFVLRPAQTTSANDSYYPRLYGLNNTGQNAFGSLARSTPEAIGPTVTSVRPAPGGSTRDRTPTISATVSDNRAELANSSIRLYVDGREITNFTYDQANDRLSYTSSRLSYGGHTVRIDVTDADRNTTTED